MDVQNAVLAQSAFAVEWLPITFKYKSIPRSLSSAMKSELVERGIHFFIQHHQDIFKRWNGR